MFDSFFFFFQFYQTHRHHHHVLQHEIGFAVGVHFGRDGLLPGSRIRRMPGIRFTTRLRHEPSEHLCLNDSLVNFCRSVKYHFFGFKCR